MVFLEFFDCPKCCRATGEALLLRCSGSLRPIVVMFWSVVFAWHVVIIIPYTPLIIREMLLHYGYMGMSPDTSDDSRVLSGSKTELSSLVFVATMADTTWRMFVPSVGFTLLGVWLDSRWQTKPWLMVFGIIVGSLGAILLVRRQLAQIKARKTKE